MPAVPRRPIVSAASGHFFARSKRLNVVQSCHAKVCFEHDVNADVVFLGHEEEAAVHAMPEMDLRLPRTDIALCDLLPETAACSWISEPLTRPARR